jgi:phospholipid/cholesterol/gamma-HCH transport system substrate-binding protein
MQVTRTTEIWVGAFVALGLVALFFVSMQVSNLGDFKSSRGSYVLKAHFGNVGGLKVRAPVSMAGVTLGRVEKITFDASRYEALVEMRIDPAFKQLPEDTSASILTAGLLGEQYIGLSAGGSDDFLKDGDEIELTQSAVILEQLISKLMFNKAEEGKTEAKKSTRDAPLATSAVTTSAPRPIQPPDAVPSTSVVPEAAPTPLTPKAENEVQQKIKSKSPKSNHKASAVKHTSAPSSEHHASPRADHASKKKAH